MSHAIIRCSGCGQLNRIPLDKRDAGPKCPRCKTSLAPRGSVAVVDDAALERLIAKSPVPVLVDFYADWCGPCRMLGPVLEEVAAELDGRLIVVKVDTERSQGWARKLGVQGIPAVHLFQGGRHVGGQTGARPKAFWRQWLASTVR